MTLKWIGAILIVACCGGFGLGMAVKFRVEEAALLALERAFMMMGSELQFRLTPLPLLCKRVAENSEGVVKRVLCAFSEELEMQIAPDAACCMEVALCRCPSLPPVTEELLREFGNAAGQFDLQGQITDLHRLQNMCIRNVEQMSINRDTRLRSYQTLGLCAGAALAILLI